MSLKSDFFDNSTGLHAQCNNAFDAGVTFVTVTNLAAISSALITAAAAGNTTFTVSLVTSYQTAILRANSGRNLINKAYLAGIQDGLAQQDVYSYEVSVALNIVDTVTTKIDINFNFQTT